MVVIGVDAQKRTHTMVTVGGNRRKLAEKTALPELAPGAEPRGTAGPAAGQVADKGKQRQGGNKHGSDGTRTGGPQLGRFDDDREDEDEADEPALPGQRTPAPADDCVARTMASRSFA